MQRIKVNSLIFSALLLCFVSVAPAFSAGTPRYDTAFIYMKPAELSRSLQQNAHNPAVLFQLLRNAQKHRASYAAFQVLDQMRMKQPKNAVVLAAYSLAYTLVSGDPLLGGGDSHPLPPDAYDPQTALLQAKQLAPHLWLPYLLEGLYEVDKPMLGPSGLLALQKAVRLAPTISITHYYLADAYLVYDKRFYSPNKAAVELQKASTLRPVIDDIAFAQLVLYIYFKHDPHKARQAKSAFLASHPPGTQYSAGTQKVLAMCP